MKYFKNCKHCSQLFEPRRSNHVYCTTSCKTKASYKRNGYKYVPGHYEKQTEDAKIDLQNKSLALATKIEKKDTVSLVSVSNAALGNVAADTLSYGLKKLLAPKALPATKGDLQLLSEKLLGRYHLINNLPRNSSGQSPYFDIKMRNVVYLNIET